ncbi:MAG: hypothetical protein JNM44_14055 [Chitinophagaceae bacterium]|nr:hypothetical protein [Chitinophagaceae bacterium]
MLNTDLLQRYRCGTDRLFPTPHVGIHDADENPGNEKQCKTIPNITGNHALTEILIYWD